ncbi:MAG TPA: SRPBCC family protein [Hanamia sp.]
MKKIIIFLSFILCVFFVIFFVCLLLPSKVTVAKSVEINASSIEVRNQIEDFSQWKNWYPAFKEKDSTGVQQPVSKNNLNSVTFTDTKGNKITLVLADTTQTEIKINLVSSSSVKVDYQFILKPKSDHETELIWNVNTYLGWSPWKRIEGIFLDKFSGPQYEGALKDLKDAAEH